jgi:hypothetical protein
MPDLAKQSLDLWLAHVSGQPLARFDSVALSVHWIGPLFFLVFLGLRRFVGKNWTEGQLELE